MANAIRKEKTPHYLYAPFNQKEGQPPLSFLL